MGSEILYIQKEGLSVTKMFLKIVFFHKFGGKFVKTFIFL